MYYTDNERLDISRETPKAMNSSLHPGRATHALFCLLYPLAATFAR